MKILTGKASITVIIILCVVSRLPQLLSDNLLLDGDECVVGLMAKHILSVRDFPLFFYGQSYGFSLIECLAILPFYAFAGMTTLSVKLAMLSLWTAGIVFMYKTFLQINPGNPILALFLILVFIFCPAWAVWSMKARGGYLTSFMLTSILLYLVFHQKIKLTFFVTTIFALLVVVIYESQPLWLPGLIPLLLYRFYKEKNSLKLSVFIMVSAACFVLFHYYKQGLVNYYSPPFFSFQIHVLSLINRIPYFLFSSLHGYYFYSRIRKPDLFTASFAYIFCGLILFLIITLLYNLAKRKAGQLLFNISVLSVLLTLSYTVFITEVHPRYLLPITGYTLLSVSLFARKINTKHFLFTVSGSVLILLGVASIISFRNFKYSTMRKTDLGQLITYLEQNQTRYVYCYDYMLTYRIIFYSKEQILCRERFLPGRFAPYIQKVDSALNNGAKTALLYNELQLWDMKFPAATNFNGYCIVFDPPKTDLAKIFQLQQ